MVHHEKPEDQQGRKSRWQRQLPSPAKMLGYVLRVPVFKVMQMIQNLGLLKT